MEKLGQLAVLGQGVVIGAGEEIDFEKLYITSGDKVPMTVRSMSLPRLVDVPIDVTGELGPASDTEGHHSTMDVVEGLRESPGLLDVINEELHVRGHTNSRT